MKIRISGRFRAYLICGIALLFSFFSFQNTSAEESSLISQDIDKMEPIVKVYADIWSGRQLREEDGSIHIDTSMGDDFWDLIWNFAVFNTAAPGWNTGEVVCPYDSIKELSYSLFCDFAGELPPVPEGMGAGGGMQLQDDAVLFRLATPEEQELSRQKYTQNADGSITVDYINKWLGYDEASNFFSVNFVPNSRYKQDDIYSFPYTVSDILCREENDTGGGSGIFKDDINPDDFLRDMKGLWECWTRGPDENGEYVPIRTARFVPERLEYNPGKENSHMEDIVSVSRERGGYRICLTGPDGTNYSFLSSEDNSVLWFYDNWEGGESHFFGTSSMSKAEEDTAADNESQTKEEEAFYGEAGDSEYIIPDSGSRYLTEEDVENLTLQQINYAKNEIYARKGRKFVSQELQDYFTSKSWYQGIYEGSAFDADLSSHMNEYEISNGEFLSTVEHQMASGGYQLDQPGYDIYAVQNKP